MSIIRIQFHLNTHKSLAIFVLTAFVYFVNTGAYAARLAGVRTGHPALASSLYNVMSIGARGANAVAGPLVASLTDLAVHGNDTPGLLSIYHTVLLAASAGTIVAGLAIPSLSRVLARGVASYALRRSLPGVVVRTSSVSGVWRLRDELKRPYVSGVRRAFQNPFPKRFLLASVLTTAIATVSNSAAMYASALVPEGARTAASLSPLLAGFGLFMTIFIVNPIAALVSDEALRGQRPLTDVSYITIWQVGAQLAGTLLAQALLVPAGWGLAVIARWLVA